MTALDTLRQHVIDHALAVAQRAADQTVIATQAAASRRTGALAAGISHDQPVYAEPRVLVTITSAAPYSQYQDEGTGIYGPAGTRIFPRTAKVLRFDWAAAGGIVFARSVAGAPGTHFWSEPMPARWADSVLASGGPP